MSLLPSPRVLVGITTRNRAHILSKAITSALTQDYPNLQVSVIDDGSTDSTPALHDKFPGIEWRRHEQPHGIIESRNELMQNTAADFYVSLDDDAWFLRNDEIAVAVEHAQRNPKVSAVAFDILSPDRPQPSRRTDSRNVAIFIGCGHLLRLSAAREAGFYAVTPGTYGSEEKDLSLRLADLGYRIALLPGVHVWHDKAWQDRNFFPIHRSGVCNEFVMTLRRCPIPDVVIVMPLKLVSYLWFWLRRPSFFLAGITGVADAVRNTPMVLRSRKPVRRSTFWKWKQGGD